MGDTMKIKIDRLDSDTIRVLIEDCYSDDCYCMKAYYQIKRNALLLQFLSVEQPKEEKQMLKKAAIIAMADTLGISARWAPIEFYDGTYGVGDRLEEEQYIPAENCAEAYKIAEQKNAEYVKQIEQVTKETHP